MADHTIRGSSEEVPEICQSCRFGSGARRECTLILASDVARLIEEGPCGIAEEFEARTTAYLRLRFPAQLHAAADLVQTVLLRFLEIGPGLRGDTLATLPAFRRWMGRFLGNAIIDHLRKVRAIARLRCGACEHMTLSQPARCTLEFLGDPTRELHPNPWWGRKVRRSTDPRRLDPPCDEFSWRRPETFDIFEKEALHRAREDAPRAEAARRVILALDALAARRPAGLGDASLLARHYLRGETVADLASRAGVSEKTVQRRLSAGRKRLLDVLREEMGAEALEELF